MHRVVGGVVIAVLVLLSACGATQQRVHEAREEGGFVRVRRNTFEVNGRSYAFVGANLWYGAHLGMEGERGDRARLRRELNRLSQIGANNLRILAGSEGPGDAPWRVKPAMQESPGHFQEELFVGLDFLLSEMAKRNMRAVLYLTNFWFWSGGMAQYVAWKTGEAIPYPLAEGGDWDAFGRFSSQFYGDREIQRKYRRHIRRLLLRRNTVSGKVYRSDPAIMAWELANEPRGAERPQEMRRWIESSASFIKRLDANHLVTTGSEGDTGAPEFSGTSFVLDHEASAIDYMTCHLWVQNWGWYDPKQASATYARAARYADHYLTRHIQIAKMLGKPVVLEEFGIARDQGQTTRSSTTFLRDAFYARILGRALTSIRKGGPLVGVNFWAWGGEHIPQDAPLPQRESAQSVPSQLAQGEGGASPALPQQANRAGLLDSLGGDPPHEPAGWYSVWDSDKTTTAVLRDYATRFARVAARR